MIFNLKSKFKPTGDQPQAIKELTEGYKEGKHCQTLLGVTGSGKTFTMANIIKNLGKKTLVLAPNKTLAAQLYGEFKEFFPDNAVEYFVSYYDYYQPEAYVVGSDTYIEKDASINEEIDKLRHSTTRNLLSRDDVIVVASVSCIYGIGDPAEYEAQKLNLFTGDIIDRDKLLQDLVAIQFERNDIDFSRGTFRVRGDTVEVFPANEDSNVIRIEFFDQEVEGIHIVDPLRGKILNTLDHITIFPKSHYVVSDEKMKRAIKSIRKELRHRLVELKEQDKLVENQRLEQRTLLDLEMMEEMGFCSGIENYSRHLTGLPPGAPPPTLLDYFRKNFLLIIDESHIAVSQVGGMYNGDRSRKENLVNYGFRLPSALDNRPLKFSEFEDKTDQVLYVSATPGDYELSQTKGEFAEQIIRPTGLLDPEIEIKDATNQVDIMLVEAKRDIKAGGRVLITTLTKRLAEELTKFYEASGMRVRYLHSDILTLERMEILQELRKGEFDILVGINLLREGLDLPEVTLVGILDADKEGFLRSERSLIQTIGRAARNAEGRVILFAYKETGSMKKAILETNRRRAIQKKYNEDNGITPKTISKNIYGGVLETLRGAKSTRSRAKKAVFGPEDISVEKIKARIKELKENMKYAAKELKFEDAARYRDEIKELSEALLLL
ncbi:MAG: excinuclease ABC subunit UvrB [Deltaproteobacteria bacterium]|nr:MAG: excinuclease ABC subunit UvrB [Deltaproteobacteria bacterium]